MEQYLEIKCVNVTLSLLCDKFLCCSRALSPRAMRQTARRVTHPAWTAEVPACWTAQCARHSRSFLMMAAAWPAVEMRHAAMIDQYPGSAVTARPHEVNKYPHWNTRRSLRPLVSSCQFRFLFWIGGYILQWDLFLANSVYECLSHESHSFRASSTCNCV